MGGIHNGGASTEETTFIKPPPRDALTMQEYYEAEEILRLRQNSLRKDDAEMAIEMEKLERERNLHIRSVCVTFVPFLSVKQYRYLYVVMGSFEILSKLGISSTRYPAFFYVWHPAGYRFLTCQVFGCIPDTGNSWISGRMDISLM
jgi:hypothetical protein